jgi:pimeloyl-ACP methyl ester carboxylesterase
LLPESELTVIPGAGHYLWIEAPELFRKALRDFLQRYFVTG